MKAHAGRDLKVIGRVLAAQQRRFRPIGTRRLARWGLTLAILGAALGCGLLGWMGVQGYHALLDAPLFAISRIEIEGLRHLNRSQVLNAAGLTLGQPVLRLDRQAVRRRLQQLPWLRGVEVVRELPNAVRIRVQERKPLALVRLPGPGQGDYLIDDSGVVLEPWAGEGEAGLPLITGIEVRRVRFGDRVGEADVLRVQQLLEVVKDIPFLQGQDGIGEVDVSHPNRLRFFTRRDRVELVVGAARGEGRGGELWSQQLAPLAVVIPLLEVPQERIRSIDLSIRGRVFVRLF